MTSSWNVVFIDGGTRLLFIFLYHLTSWSLRSEWKRRSMLYYCFWTDTRDTHQWTKIEETMFDSENNSQYFWRKYARENPKFRLGGDRSSVSAVVCVRSKNHKFSIKIKTNYHFFSHVKYTSFITLKRPIFSRSKNAKPLSWVKKPRSWGKKSRCGRALPHCTKTSNRKKLYNFNAKTRETASPLTKMKQSMATTKDKKTRWYKIYKIWYYISNVYDFETCMNYSATTIYFF